MNKDRCFVCGYSDYQDNGIWNGYPLYQCNNCGVDYWMPKSYSKIAKLIQVVAYYKNWAMAVFDRLRVLQRQPIIYKLKSGVTFLVYAGTHDVQVINEIWIDQIYSPWRQRIQPEWIVVDLGSQRGIFTVYAAKQAKYVYAVEANPEVACFWQANIAMNKLSDKVSLLQGAIACTEGTADFFIARDAGMSGLVQREFVDVERHIKVKKISIKNLLQDLIIVHLLKIDVEGAEFDLFAEVCARDWLNKVERIAMEYHDNPATIVNTLKQFGFRVILWPDRKMLYAEHPSIIAMDE